MQGCGPREPTRQLQSPRPPALLLPLSLGGFQIPAGNRGYIQLLRTPTVTGGAAGVDLQGLSCLQGFSSRPEGDRCASASCGSCQGGDALAGRVAGVESFLYSRVWLTAEWHEGTDRLTNCPSLPGLTAVAGCGTFSAKTRTAANEPGRVGRLRHRSALIGIPEGTRQGTAPPTFVRSLGVRKALLQVHGLRESNQDPERCLGPALWISGHRRGKLRFGGQ